MRQKLFFILTFSIFWFFVSAQEPKLMLPVGHSLGVSSAVFSPDGKRMVTASLDNRTKIWEVETGRLLADLMGHTDTVVTANFSRDGKKIVTACEDGTAKIWDAVSTTLLADIKGHTNKVYVAEFSPDDKKIVTGSEDQTAKIWDVTTGKLLADLKGHSKAIWSVFFSPDGKKVATGSDDYTAKIWDAVSGKLLADLKGHTFEVWSVEFSPDGKKLITASGDSTAKIWDVATGALLSNIIDHRSQVRFARFSPDGKKFVTASDDGDVKLWNAETGVLIANINGKKVFKVKTDSHYPDIVRAADFSPDGKKLLTVYRDSATKIWDAATGKHLIDIKRSNEYVNFASFSKDSKKFALALAFAHVEIYDVSRGNLVIDLKGNANHMSGFAYSKDGKRILISNWVGSAKILDAATGSLVANLPAINNSPMGVSAVFSPDGKKAITVSADNVARVWDIVTGAHILDLKGHTKSVIYAWFSPDSKKIYTSSLDSTGKIWDAATGNLLMDLKRDGPFAIQYLRPSPDGRRILSAQGNIARLWDTKDGRLVAVLKGHKSFFNVDFSPLQNRILTFSNDSIAKTWDSETGALLLDLKETGKRIRTMRFSPDGNRIVVVSDRGRGTSSVAKMLDALTGNLITELKYPGASFRWNILYSPDGKKIFASMEDGTINIWDAESGALIRELKGLRPPVFLYSINSFSTDGKLLIIGDPDGMIKIWDIETGILQHSIKAHAFNIQSAFFTPDAKKFVTLSTDHTAKIWDAATASLLYTFISVNEEDYIVLDKYNHFDGTEAGRKILYFTCGTEVIELDQLKDQLWVPNLTERILNGEPINAAKLADLNICNLTPVVDPVDQTASQYRFQITPRLGGLGATMVYVNGIEVKRYMPQQLVRLKDGYQLAIEKKELQKFFVTSKENSITVKSLTAKNSISSRSATINEKANETLTALPNLFAVLVGVSDYKGEELDLKFAAKDAVDMGNAIDISAKKLLNTDGKEHVFIYKIHTGAGRDKFPEKNSIRQVFTEISGKARPNDILLIFFAGHGVMESEKNQFYFLTADASNATVTGALKNVGISTDELAEWIKPQVMQAQKRILIFDACNSGQVIKELVSVGGKGQNFLASRGDEKGRQVKAIEKLNERSGMFILSASASDQKAYEMGKYNQGTLTYSLLKAIKEQPSILEDRKYLNISRWFNAAEKSVGEMARETGARQQPQIVSTTNFNIGVVDEDVRNNILLPFEKHLFTRSDFRNIDLRVDNLKLRNLVDNQLEDISGAGSTASFIYSPEYDGANVYAISGDYTISGNAITTSVIVTKGGTEIKTRFDVKGTLDDLNGLTNQITSAITGWLKNYK